jgi:hypothetical protein
LAESKRDKLVKKIMENLAERKKLIEEFKKLPKREIKKQEKVKEEEE